MLNKNNIIINEGKVKREKKRARIIKNNNMTKKEKKKKECLRMFLDLKYQKYSMMIPRRFTYNFLSFCIKTYTYIYNKNKNYIYENYLE